MSANEVECRWAAGAVLGECPLWRAAEDAIYWVDVKGPALHRYRIGDGARMTWEMPERIGFVAERASASGFVAGFKSGFAFLELDPLSIRRIADPDAALPGNRLNDGMVDRRGRLWAGTMDDSEREPTGWLYRLDPDLALHRCDGPYAVTNGPAISPDGRTLYHTDTLGRTIYRFDLEADGTLAAKRAFVRFAGDEGYPDGMTADADSCLWVAHWGGWRLTRFTPGGEVDRIVRMPVAQVTSCAFAGRNLDRLFVTSASIGLDATARARQPLAGGLFEVTEPGAQGLAPGRFAG